MASAPNKPEEPVVHAPEAIADYLRRIEVHLAAIAARLPEAR
jgi:hypothetical protein